MNDVVRDLFSSNDSLFLSEEVNGTAYATAVIMETVLAIIVNLFILIFTLCHPKTLKQPSIIFLTNFIVANLLMVFVYLPFVAITAIERDWIFGKTVAEKVATCQFVGYILTLSLSTQTFNLTLISIDRFLFIVKPLVYKHYMKTWVAVVVSALLFTMSFVWACLPMLGLGAYSIGRYSYDCSPVQDDMPYFASSLFVILVCLITIAVTSIWTYCFTRNYIRRTGQAMNSDSKSVYNTKLLKIMGIFGTMLLVTAVTYTPVVIFHSIGIIAPIPAEIYAVAFILYHTVPVSNPIIQIYFRRDINEFINLQFKKSLNWITKQLIE